MGAMSLYKVIRTQPLFVIKKQIINKALEIDVTNCGALNYAIALGKRDIALYLIDMNINVNKQHATEPSSTTPLHNAVNLGDMELVRVLLSRNASALAIDAKSNTPLHLAFILGYSEIKELLLDFIVKSANFLNLKNNHGLSHFLIACTSRNAISMLRYIQTESNLADVIDSKSPYYPGYSPLDLAIEFKSPIAIKVLLEHGVGYLNNQVLAALELAKTSHGDLSIIIDMLSAHIQQASLNEISQFHLACMLRNPALVNSFLGYGAAVNSQVNEQAIFCARYTPLHCAVESGCKENIKVLLQCGADVTLADAYFMTPLHLALYNDNKDILSLIYEWTTNKVTQCTDSNGLNYFHVAVAMNDIIVVKKYLDQSNLSINAKVNHNHRNFSGFTALHFALRYGHTNMAKLLVLNGANVQTSDKAGYGTPLHMAVSAGNCKLIKLFLDNEARTDVLRPYDYKNMLHLLVESYMDANGRTNRLLDFISTFVVKYDLNINAKDSDGYTPLHYACKKISVGSPCIKVLLDYGADINIENNVHDTPFEMTFYDFYRNNADDYMLLYNHVKGLLKLELTVNPKNEHCCRKMLKEHDELQKGAECLRVSSLNKKQQQRSNEILGMKKLLLTKKTSLYGFLFKNKKELRQFANNRSLSTIIRSLSEDFPNFGYLVKLQYYRSQKLASKSA